MSQKTVEKKSVLASNIEALWKSSKLSQAEFGEKYGSNQKSVWAYIHGVNVKPSTDFMLSVARDHMVDPDWLKKTKVKLSLDGRIVNYPSKQTRKEQLLGFIKDFRALNKEYERKIVAFERQVKKL